VCRVFTACLYPSVQGLVRGMSVLVSEGLYIRFVSRYSRACTLCLVCCAGVSTACLSRYTKACSRHVCMSVQYLCASVCSPCLCPGIQGPVCHVLCVVRGSVPHICIQVYEGLYAMSVRDFKRCASLFLDAISTFTSYELMEYVAFVEYTVYISMLALDRYRSYSTGRRE
jgi:hypothetical protein